ncbi:MAG TPA: hypothetical protein VJ201_05095 [Candidatus Babeliales bacterium]|nr:hypothetical protein [Candidatus Babeliales bacterium]
MADPVITNDLLVYILAPVGTFVFGWILNALKNKDKLKNVLHSVRVFIDGADDAIYDDKVDEKEFRLMWDNGVKVIRSFQ